MKKFLVLCCAFGLLTMTVVPAFAELSFSGDLASGDYRANYMDGVEREPATDVVGGIFGLGYNYHNWMVNFDYVYGDLDQKIIGDDTLGLGDFRVGYRFFNTDSLKASAMLFYIADANGVFKAPAVGLGAEYFFNDRWSIDGRIGYSPAGVDVDCYVSTYEDAAVLPVAVGLNYRISDSWSFHTAYRYYAFTGETNGTDLESKIQLASAGLTYKLGAKATPAPAATPKATPAPTETPKATPAPTATPQATLAPTVTPKATPAPTATPQATPAPTVTPQATPVPTATLKPELAIKEREEALNHFLQPVFFNFDSASIRPNQIPVLENNLKILKEASDLNILIGGHADQKGTSEYNKKLSQKRAENVRTWLINHGISAQRIKVAAYGSQNPYFHRTKDPKWESDRWVDTIVAIDVPSVETGIRK